MKFYILTMIGVAALMAWLWFGQLTGDAAARITIGVFCALVALVAFGWLVITGKVDR